MLPLTSTSRLTAIGLALLLPLLAAAQPSFQRTYGGPQEDEAFDIHELTDGYILGGRTESYGAGDADLYVIRTDRLGDTLWTRTYGGPQDENGSAIQVTLDGFLLMGHTGSFGAGSYDLWLLKMNAFGDTQWSRLYGGAQREEHGWLLRLESGELVFSATTQSYGAGDDDMWVVKTDAGGNQLWAKTYGGTGHDYARGLLMTSDGGFLLCGSTESYGAGQSDFWALKLDASGDTQWTRTYGGPMEDHGWGGREVADGYMLTGMTMSSGAGSFDLWLIKTDASGNMLWSKTYGGQYYELGCTGNVCSDGNYILCGTCDYTGADAAVWLIKINPAGEILWDHKYGGSQVDNGFFAQQTSDGGFCIAGGTWSFGAGEQDAYLIKTDSAGNIAIAEPQSPPQRPRVALTCRPNPAVRSTVVDYSMARGQAVGLAVYDALGQHVRTLRARGSSGQVNWDCTSDDGRPVPAAPYFCRLQTSDGTTETAMLNLTR